MCSFTRSASSRSEGKSWPACVRTTRRDHVRVRSFAVYSLVAGHSFGESVAYLLQRLTAWRAPATSSSALGSGTRASANANLHSLSTSIVLWCRSAASCSSCSSKARSEERRVGKDNVSKSRSRCLSQKYKKKDNIHET